MKRLVAGRDPVPVPLAWLASIRYNTRMDREAKKITILVPADIVAAMKRLAAEQRRSMNQEMIRAFEEHLKRHAERQGK